MIPRELARKIRTIQIYTTKVVNDVLAGEYVSVFKGRGMEFDEVREYQVGDDVRSIDWNVTARAGKPFIKKFREERELTVIFLVDLSASGSFGSVKQTKNELAAEICALLAFAAIRNNDKVGLIVFTDQVEMFIPPGKGARHVLRVIREILTLSVPGAPGPISPGLWTTWEGFSPEGPLSSSSATFRPRDLRSRFGCWGEGMISLPSPFRTRGSRGCPMSD